MGLLPSFLEEEIEEAGTQALVVEVPEEYEVDFATGLLTGRIVKGKEAVKVWIWNCLMTERFRYPIYSWDYGVEFERYIGKTLPTEFLETEFADAVSEALLQNEHIQAIRDFALEKAGTKLRISLTAVTDFGNVEVEGDV